MKRRAAVSLLLLAPLFAQADDAVRHSCGVTIHEGVVYGLGPDYSARFEPHGVTFTPALGKLVAAPQTLQFTLTSVRRGAANAWQRTADRAPDVDGNLVRFRHSVDLAEVYDVRADGIEQSFVFASRPAGEGDLVVRGSITTNLPLAHVGDDGVRFERADAGGVSFGGVTGIDANGARCRGSLRCIGKELELVLPATFVDAATYPLVLDPLIGSSFLIANIAGGSDVQPSIAYDEATQRHLVVWSIPMSTTVAEVRGQFVSAAGFVGSQMLLDSSAVPGVRPAVANINQHDRFVVAWAGSLPLIAVAAVDAVTGIVSSTTGVTNFGQYVDGIALGGDSRTPAFGTAENALLVATWSLPSNPLESVTRTLVQIPAVAAPTVLSSVVLFAQQNQAFGPPAVTKHAGSTGRWMYVLVWRSASSPTVINGSAVMVTVNGTFCDSTAWAVTAPNGAGMHTAVATSDGNRFLLAYETSDQAFVLRRLSRFGACGSPNLALAAPFSPAASNAGHQYPELDFAGDKFVLAYRQPSTSTTPLQQVRVLGIGLQDGMGQSVLAQFSTLAQIDPAVASRWSGGDSTSNEALVVWASSGIRGQRWQATGTGTVTSLGGACGIPGLSDVNTYTGTPVIGTTFTISLLAPTAPVLALIVGFSQNPFACGPCTIVPSADIVLAGGGPVPVVVPLDANLIGFELYTQWLQLRPSGCPLLPDFGFSGTLKFTIAE